MKKAVQLTMMHVENYGSVLQTYALQKAIESVKGWRCEAIDIRPDVSDKTKTCPAPAKPIVEQTPKITKPIVAVKPLPLPLLLIRKAYTLLRGGVIPVLLNKLRNRRLLRERVERKMVFESFRAKEISRTRRYADIDDLRSDPPVADLYVTGSDQTFNARYTGCDPLWFFSFLSPKRARSAYRKISYASSAGANGIRPECLNSYLEALSDYDSVSTRETSVAESLSATGVKATACCDPTLLFDRKFWWKFARKAKLRIRKPYILNYNLTYLCDPRSASAVVEERVADELGLPILDLDTHARTASWRGSGERFTVSVYDFVRLFLNARFVITSSFHGTAFALQAGCPFATYVHGDEKVDCRAWDLLRRCRAERHAVDVSCSWRMFEMERFNSTALEQASLREYAAWSKGWLENALAFSSNIDLC